ncbi:MAG: hypothetical protein QXK70_01850 [Archaeoglobaceae archaeon]
MMVTSTIKPSVSLKNTPYCEIIVAAKDYAMKRRKPKAEIFEL